MIKRRLISLIWMLLPFWESFRGTLVWRFLSINQWFCYPFASLGHLALQFRGMLLSAAGEAVWSQDPHVMSIAKILGSAWHSPWGCCSCVSSIVEVTYRHFTVYIPGTLWGFTNTSWDQVTILVTKRVAEGETFQADASTQCLERSNAFHHKFCTFFLPCVLKRT